MSAINYKCFYCKDNVILDANFLSNKCAKGAEKTKKCISCYKLANHDNDSLLQRAKNIVSAGLVSLGKSLKEVARR